MVDHFRTALQLFGIGMMTVFLILALVVLAGHMVINLGNYFFSRTASTAQNVNNHSDQSNGGSQELGKYAAIAAVVDLITEGNGRVTSIEQRGDNK